MTFNKCSISGKCYGDVLDDHGVQVDPESVSLSESCIWIYICSKLTANQVDISSALPHPTLAFYIWISKIRPVSRVTVPRSKRTRLQVAFRTERELAR